jgi:hypothetical protein
VTAVPQVKIACEAFKISSSANGKGKNRSQLMEGLTFYTYTEKLAAEHS